jgi:transposase
MIDMVTLLKRWQVDEREVRERMYRAPTPRERERWHALWLLARGWSESQVAEALERDPHTIGSWVAAFGEAGPRVWPSRRQVAPPALDAEVQAHLKAAVQAPPRAVGMEMANWNWRGVREFVARHFGVRLCRSSCLNYLHRLGFVLKRPRKRLTKADAAKRKDFVTLYAALRQEAAQTGAMMWVVDEALFRADAELRGIWVLKGEPALADASSPSLKEKVVYYSAVCLETGEVEAMEVDGICTAETAAAFLRASCVRSIRSP